MADVIKSLVAHQRRIDNQYGKHVDVDPADFLSEAQSDFIDYMLTPGHGTQADWARERGIQPIRTTEWKRQKFFMAEWDRRAKKVNGGIERVQSVIDAIFAQAKAGDMKAAQLYLQYVDKFTPTRKIEVEDTSVSTMTDDELRNAALSLAKGTQ